MFSIRLVILDHYVSKPIGEFSLKENESEAQNRQEPVLRIFGSTPDGTKSCVHVHGVYPYMYVPFKGGDNPEREALLLGAALDEALKASTAKGGLRFVHKVTLVSGTPLYGYHSRQRQFFKIYFYNPYHIRKASDLLLSGAILGMKLQPHEAHIPYGLQFMMDYNIYGMSFVTFSRVKYRRDPENPELLPGVTEEDSFSLGVRKMTWSSVEVDAWARDITNRSGERAVGGNPGLRAIWEEEKARRRARDGSSQITFEETPSRPEPQTCAAERMYRERLAKKLENVCAGRAEAPADSQERSHGHAYPAEVTDCGGLLEASALEAGVESSGPTDDSLDVGPLIDEAILTRIAESQRERTESDGEEDGTEADSVLGRNREEEPGAELEDEEGDDMTQPLDSDEDAAGDPDANRDEPGGSRGATEETFWRNMADRIFQLDGAQESSSESDVDVFSGRECGGAFGSPVSQDAGLSVLEGSHGPLQLSPAWSGNIMSLLREDGLCGTPSATCQTPQTFWCNYSPKMDAWLSQSQESWTWTASGTVPEECFPQNPEEEVSSTVDGRTRRESSKDCVPEGSRACPFGIDEEECSSSSAVTPPRGPESSLPVSPPSAILTPASELDGSEANFDFMSASVGHVLTSSTSQSESSEAVAEGGEDSQKTAVPRVVERGPESDQEKPTTAVECFAGNQVPSDSRRLTVCLTLKQYIKDCKEIVSVDFKNLCNREMVIIEYKSLNERCLQNKFLIKPLDKFLEKWNAAERKANERLSQTPAGGFGVRGSTGRENFRSVVNVFRGKPCESSRAKSAKNKFTVKSMEILRDDPTPGTDPRRRGVDENFISRGRIRMKLIKSRAESSRSPASEAADGSPDANVTPREPRSAFARGGRLTPKGSKRTRDERKDRTKGSGLNGPRRERKESPAAAEQRVKRWRRFSELDAKLIKEINASFEEYFKNVVRLKTASGKRKRNLRETARDEGGAPEESTEDECDGRSDAERWPPAPPARGGLSPPTADSMKFVSRFLSTLSRMSRSADMPPVSITISLGNGCGPAPVHVNLQPTVPSSTASGDPGKRQKRRPQIENVDGPADGSSSDDSGDESGDPESRRGSPDQKRKKRDAFYKPLKVVLRGTPSPAGRAPRRRRTCGAAGPGRDEEQDARKSSPRASRDHSGGCRERSRRSRVPGGKEGQSEGKISCQILVKSRTSPVGDGKPADKMETETGQASAGSREPDFIYDSDQERESTWKLRRGGVAGASRAKKKSVLERIPQADTDAAASSDDDTRRPIASLPGERSQAKGREPEPAKPADVTTAGDVSGKRPGDSFFAGSLGIEMWAKSFPIAGNAERRDEYPPPKCAPAAAAAEGSDSPGDPPSVGVLAEELASPPSTPPATGDSREAFGGTESRGPGSSWRGAPEVPPEDSDRRSSSPSTRSWPKSVEFQVGDRFSECSTDKSGQEGAGRVSGAHVLRPKHDPVTRNEVESFLRRPEMSGVTEQAPFYGDARDLTKAMEAGPRLLKIEGRSAAGLKPFKSTLEISGAEERRNLLLNLPRREKHRDPRFLLGTRREMKITPLRRPPTPGSVLEWSARRGSEGNGERARKPRAKIVKTSGSEAEDSEEDLELSVTLSCFSEEATAPKAASHEDSAKALSAPEGAKRRTPTGTGTASLPVRGSGATPEVADEPREEGIRRRASCGAPKRGSDNSFQIRGVTPENTLGFSGSAENMKEARSSHSHQFLGLLLMELHVQTRKDLRPDPDHDPVRALFYGMTFDSPARAPETGMIVVGERLPADCASSKQVVHHVPTEKALLEKIIALVRRWDPDILAGYEIEMHSWGYLIQRGFILEMNLIHLLGRIRDEDPGSWKNPTGVPPGGSEFEDLPRSIRQLKIPGRIVLDIWRVLRHEVALTSYTFENVMYHLSHERHPLLSYGTLSLYWEHPGGKLRRLAADHYVTRVLGTARLLDQLDFVNRTSELSRLFGIQFYEVLSRGSQFRVESMMLRLAKPLNYVAVSPSVAQRAEMRAPACLPLIMEPESLFYTDPLVVLDFQSLYPSIIIAYNYCFSTCLGRVENLGRREPFEFGCTQLQISPEEMKSLEEEVTISPAGVAFVKPNTRKGVLPSMLEEILETRLMVKKSMKQNRDNKTLQKILYARQLGLKLIANVTYGYTAANFSGRMPCIEVGDSVVSKGRETLHRAISLIKNTAKWGARVVYGDTDSVFVLTPGRSREEAFRIGAEIAEAVTRDNPKPVKLKLEKVYQPSILQTKKRYVGYMYECPEQEKPVLEAKGIETVRRDGCPATAKILEKSLRILFDTRDVSLVKKYAVRQFAKLFQGRANVQDMIFAKEYRGRRGYRPGACVPALHLARQWTQKDKRAEPRVKERVPYVIVSGPPGVPLIRLVRSPRDLLDDDGLRINAVYYVTKALVPPMQRCFSLLGVDVSSWYSEIPRKYLKARKPVGVEAQRKSTISQYFAATECLLCRGSTDSPLCPECERRPQAVAVRCWEKIRRWERCHAGLLKICQGCCGRATELDCESIDCPVLFRRRQASRDLEQGPAVHEVLARYL